MYSQRMHVPFTDWRTESNKQLWRAADLADHLPSANWSDYVASPLQRANCLESVLRLGFVFLNGVPIEPGTVLSVVETFGFVRETNYGRLFDVQEKPNPNNLAFTNLPITPHTDNPYRDPVPSLQLLHCLTNAAEGGESGLVDGFQVAALLRSLDQEAFELLARTDVSYAFRDASTELRACKPTIEVDGLGLIRGIRFSDRHAQPLRLGYDKTVAFDRAYRQFAELAYDPDLQVTFKLEPGDCVIFDNTRVLHARTAFASGGARHLQGCYADIDGLASSLAVLRR
jgi:gamma-butyrobetaine dioxygenase